VYADAGARRPQPPYRRPGRRRAGASPARHGSGTSTGVRRARRGLVAWAAVRRTTRTSRRSLERRQAIRRSDFSAHANPHGVILTW